MTHWSRIYKVISIRGDTSVGMSVLAVAAIATVQCRALVDRGAVSAADLMLLQ